MEDRKPKDEIVICCGNCIYLRKCFGDTYCTNPDGLVGTITKFDNCEHFTERNSHKKVEDKIKQALETLSNTCRKHKLCDDCPIYEVLGNVCNDIQVCPEEWKIKGEEHE